MVERVFVDTNVFVYDARPDDPIRSPLAAALLSRHGRDLEIVASLQVLREFLAAVRSSRRGEAFSEEAAWDYANEVIRPLLGGTEDLVLYTEAHRLRMSASLSVYDSMILASALRAGCVALYTEDFQTARRFGALEIRNPFRPVVE